MRAAVLGSGNHLRLIGCFYVRFGRLGGQGGQELDRFRERRDEFVRAYGFKALHGARSFARKSPHADSQLRAGKAVISLTRAVRSALPGSAHRPLRRIDGRRILFHRHALANLQTRFVDPQHQVAIRA